MFEYLDPDADRASNRPPALGDGSLPVPPNAGPPGQGIRPLRPERVRHLLYGSLPALARTIKILHAQGYADPNDWSDPLPVPQGSSETRSPSPAEGRSPSPAEPWMVILTKTVLLE
jgi:hypothetical protein